MSAVNRLFTLIGFAQAMKHDVIPAASAAFSRPRMSPADIWLQQVFDAKSARFGRVVRRSAADIETIVGWHRFVAELERRGFHAIENAGQVVIFCNNQPLRVVR